MDNAAVVRADVLVHCCTRVVCAGGGLALASAQCPSCGGWWVEAGPHHQAGCGAGHCSSSPPPVSQLCQYLSWSIVNKYTNTSNSQPTLLTVIWETFPTSFILLFLLPALPSLVLLGVVAGSCLLVAGCWLSVMTMVIVIPVPVLPAALVMVSAAT